MGSLCYGKKDGGLVNILVFSGFLFIHSFIFIVCFSVRESLFLEGGGGESGPLFHVWVILFGGSVVMYLLSLLLLLLCFLLFFLLLVLLIVKTVIFLIIS